MTLVGTDSYFLDGGPDGRIFRSGRMLVAPVECALPRACIRCASRDDLLTRVCKQTPIITDRFARPGAVRVRYFLCKRHAQIARARRAAAVGALIAVPVLFFI